MFWALQLFDVDEVDGVESKKNVKKSEALLEENTTVMSVNLFIVSW